ncbi:helix-turn-helix domain-containing protein [Maritalea porphyrae]|uniref:helix-turn-helix domain-containing protein n=1 Tax=Maritalea porphyrae TaxID=880732 RepID=UPI0022AFC41C|nr:helix-turn-helix domain-containing protein [Maritalea porphyrae]MCZ4270729.1 helix-turn-helix domain-containing protein [Maritalea porphyrae]
MAVKSTNDAEFLPQTCKVTDLAEMLGVNKRTIQNLAQSGIIKRAPRQRGVYLTLESLNNCFEHYRKIAAGRTDDDELADLKLRAQLADTETKELKRDELKGNVLSVDEVSNAWTAVCMSFKRKLLTTPSKLRGLIPHLTTHDQETVRVFMTELLIELGEEVEQGVIGANPEPLHVKATKRKATPRKRAKKVTHTT